MAGEVYRELGEAAWAWVLGQVREDEGPWLPEVVAGDGPAAGPGAGRDSVYAGIGGLAPVLAEIGQHRALTGAEKALAGGIVARLGATVPARTEPSLYDGRRSGQAVNTPTASPQPVARPCSPWQTRPRADWTGAWCPGPGPVRRTTHTAPRG